MKIGICNLYILIILKTFWKISSVCGFFKFIYTNTFFLNLYFILRNILETHCQLICRTNNSINTNQLIRFIKQLYNFKLIKRWERNNDNDNKTCVKEIKLNLFLYLLTHLVRFWSKLSVQNSKKEKNGKIEKFNNKKRKKKER